MITYIQYWLAQRRAASRGRAAQPVRLISDFPSEIQALAGAKERPGNGRDVAVSDENTAQSLLPFWSDDLQ